MVQPDCTTLNSATQKKESISLELWGDTEIQKANVHPRMEPYVPEDVVKSFREMRKFSTEIKLVENVTGRLVSAKLPSHLKTEMIEGRFYLF